jgi:hypothetical protein
VNGQPIHEQHHTGNNDKQSDNTEPQRAAPTERTPPNGNQHRPRRHCYIRFEWPKLALEILTLGIVIFYAVQNWRQANSTRRAANAAHDAALAAIANNRIAHQNAVVDLRAYVGLGGPNNRLADIIVNKRTGKVAIPVYFFNGGRTPAHGFVANLATMGLPRSTNKFTEPDIGRFEFVDGNMRGIRKLKSSGIDIPSGTTYTQYLDTSQIPTKKELTNIYHGTRFEIVGSYVFCDEFGEFRCKNLWLNFDSAQETFVPGPFEDADCGIRPSVPEPASASQRILTRCKQPKEQQQEDAIADEYAGKIIPPRASSSPKPTPADLSKPE